MDGGTDASMDAAKDAVVDAVVDAAVVNADERRRAIISRLELRNGKCKTGGSNRSRGEREAEREKAQSSVVL